MVLLVLYGFSNYCHAWKDYKYGFYDAGAEYIDSILGLTPETIVKI